MSNSLYTLPIGVVHIGCFLVAVTSLLVIILYLHKDDARNQRGDVPPYSTENAAHHACNLAKNTTTFLGYLKRLDEHSTVTFPVHCRQIDFYLACRMKCDDETSTPNSQDTHDGTDGFSDDIDIPELDDTNHQVET